MHSRILLEPLEFSKCSPQTQPPFYPPIVQVPVPSLLQFPLPWPCLRLCPSSSHLPLSAHTAPFPQHQLVSQPGLNRGLILDLLDKLRNPGKGAPTAEVDEEELEVRVQR